MLSLAQLSLSLFIYFSLIVLSSNFDFVNWSGNYLVSTQQQFYLFCCLGCGCCWVVTTKHHMWLCEISLSTRSNILEADSSLKLLIFFLPKMFVKNLIYRGANSAKLTAVFVRNLTVNSHQFSKLDFRFGTDLLSFVKYASFIFPILPHSLH